jgi:hypothetical protein
VRLVVVVERGLLGLRRQGGFLVHYRGVRLGPVAAAAGEEVEERGGEESGGHCGDQEEDG